jgi:hypothetical protein
MCNKAKSICSYGIPWYYNYQNLSKLTTWSRFLPEKLRVTQLVKKFPVFYGNRRFITVFTRTRHRSLPRARWIKSKYLYPISLSSIVIYSDLSLDLTRGLFPSCFLNKICRKLGSNERNTSFEAFIALMCQVEVFCVVTSCRVVVW